MAQQEHGHLTIKVAVIGLGKMGLSHLAMINSIDAFSVVAICDSTPLVGGVIGKYGKLRHLSDVKSVLGLPELDAIVIATPTTTHAELIQAGLDRGLHVFCEKPLTLSAAQSETFAALASERGLVAQVGYHNRFVGTFREVKRLLDAGAIGRVTHVLAEAYGPVVLQPAKPTWRSKSGQGGGCLYDYAVHPINLMNWYFGRPQSCSGAMLKSLFSAEVDDEVYAMLGFADGITGQLSVNWSDPSVRKMSTRVSIWGEGGKIFADRQEIQLFRTGTAPAPEGYGDGWTVKYITELTPPVSFYLRGEEYTAQLEAFGRAILDRTQSIENSFGSAAETDQAIEMIRGAAEGQVSASHAALAPHPVRRASIVGRLMGR